MSSRPPYRSSPPSHPSPYRYLGSGGGERPVRVQVIIGLVAGLILVAVPLYLWRRPQPDSIPTADAAPRVKVLDARIVLPKGPIDAGPPPIVLSPFTTIGCSNPGLGRTPAERCDRVAAVEDALTLAINENRACAPAFKKAYDVSYVMEFDFKRKKFSVYAGKSTTLPRAKAKSLTRCVQKALVAPDWSAIPHQYVKYQINVIASYPASDPGI